MRSTLEELVSFQGQLKESWQALWLLMVHEMHLISMAAKCLPGSSLPCYACVSILMQPYAVSGEFECQHLGSWVCACVPRCLLCLLCQLCCLQAHSTGCTNFLYLSYWAKPVLFCCNSHSLWLSISRRVHHWSIICAVVRKTLSPPLSHRRDIASLAAAVCFCWAPRLHSEQALGHQSTKSWWTTLLVIGSFQVSICPEHVSQFRTPFLPLDFPPRFFCLPGSLQSSLPQDLLLVTVYALKNCGPEMLVACCSRQKGGHHFQLLHPIASYPILAPSVLSSY